MGGFPEVDFFLKEPPIKRTSITLTPRVYEAGLEIAAQRGFRHSFSAYVAWLIERDAQGGVVREEVSPASTAPAANAKPSTRTARQRRSSGA